MVKILEKELEEIVIMGRNRFQSPEDLARFVALEGRGKQPLYWASGVAFIYSPLPMSKMTIVDLIKKRRVYWAYLHYSIMPEYQPIIETKEKLIVPILDFSMSANFRKVGEWLKGLP